jgi:hypothetical protein
MSALMVRRLSDERDWNAAWEAFLEDRAEKLKELGRRPPHARFDVQGSTSQGRDSRLVGWLTSRPAPR